MKKQQIWKYISVIALVTLVFSLFSFTLSSAVTLTADADNRYPSANIDIDGDGQLEWIIEPNLWNVQSGSGSVTMTYTESSGNLNVDINLQNIQQEDPNGWVHAYPEIWYGAKGFNTLGPVNDGPFTLPQQLSQLNDFSTRVQYSVNRRDPGLPFNFCFETWLTQDTSRGSIESNEVEIMIWLTYNGLQGFGSTVGSITVGGISYTIYRSDAVSAVGWEGFAFLPTSPADSATKTIQWGPFIQECASRSRISNWGDLYFTAVELGSEFGSPSYLSGDLEWSLTDFTPSTMFTVHSENILGGGGTTPPTEPPTEPPSGEYQDISVPFTYDGTGDLYWRTTTLGNYINSWNLQTLTINGVDFTNKWAPGDQWPWGNNLPAKVDGYYYIHYVGNYPWSHFEAKT